MTLLSIVRCHLKLSRMRMPLSSLLAIACKKDEWEDDEVFKDITSFHRLRLSRGARALVSVETDLMLEKSIPGGIDCHTTYSDGLVASESVKGTVLVCNAATNEFVMLPPGSNDDRFSGFTEPTAAIGFDPWRNRPSRHLSDPGTATTSSRSCRVHEPLSLPLQAAANLPDHAATTIFYS
ncbi:hypothetical protein E2562_007111 [Oryza meyeriana var. granulata]|uniref:Uncharacterized protein n=1 Tax=Oryza meyeriana var. granulata TaxID=110450 RepID=A0A6G1F4Y0_9ORYZ|nr:hypothetical protein E2562_007111 [Oryza meyeriana var. granulata]